MAHAELTCSFTRPYAYGLTHTQCKQRAINVNTVERNVFFWESTAAVPTANSFGVWQLGSKAVFRFVPLVVREKKRADNTHS